MVDGNKEFDLNRTRYSIIYPPTINWSGPIYQRPHQLQSEFARLGHFALLANKTNDGKGGFWFTDENLCISNDLEGTLSDPEIKKVMEGTRKIFWVTFPPTLSYKDVVKPDMMVFDYLDEGIDEFSFWKPRLDECMKTADVIFVVSKRLLELVKAQYPDKTFLIPNGADIRQFLREDISTPEDMKPLKGKYKHVVGFMGALYSWVDFNLIKDMALERPDWAFALVGPKYCDTHAIDGISNIHLLGAKNYNTLVNYVKSFDAGIIPFEVRDMTNSSNPIKMYEYLAAGIPVVTTPIKECTSLAPYIRTAGTGHDSILKIEEAIRACKSERPDYIRIGKENSWTRRVMDIISILGKHL